MFQKYRNIRQLENAEVIHYNFVNELLHHNEETLTNHGARTSPAYTRRKSRMLNIIVYYYIVIQLLLAFSQGKFLQRKLFCLKLSQDSLN